MLVDKYMFGYVFEIRITNNAWVGTLGGTNKAKMRVAEQ
jgi:hypothetical protein